MAPDTSSDLCVGASNTTGARRRNGQTAYVNLFPAYKTDPVLARVHPTQGAFNGRQFIAPASCRFERHLLCLHGIHAR